MKSNNTSRKVNKQALTKPQMEETALGISSRLQESKDKIKATASKVFETTGLTQESNSLLHRIEVHKRYTKIIMYGAIAVVTVACFAAVVFLLFPKKS